MRIFCKHEVQKYTLIWDVLTPVRKKNISFKFKYFHLGGQKKTKLINYSCQNDQHQNVVEFLRGP